MSLMPPSVHPEVLHALGDRCEQAVKELEEGLELLDRQTRPNDGWTGPSADSFRRIVEDQLDAARRARALLVAAADAFHSDAHKARLLWVKFNAEVAAAAAEEIAKNAAGAIASGAGKIKDQF